MAGFLNPGSASTTVSSKPYPPVENFKIYIKRDPTLFISLKYKALCENWNRNVISTAWTQDVEDIFHKSHVPSTPDDIDLFREKQKHMYSVFVKILLTYQGRKIVREHQGDKYARKVYKKFYICTTIYKGADKLI